MRNLAAVDAPLQRPVVHVSDESCVELLLAVVRTFHRTRGVDRKVPYDGLFRNDMEKPCRRFPVGDRVAAAVKNTVENSYRYKVLHLGHVDVSRKTYYPLAVGPWGNILAGIGRGCERHQFPGRRYALGHSRPDRQQHRDER